MRQRTPFRRIDIEQAISLLPRENLLLLDARDANSFDASHIDDAQFLSGANLSGFLGSPEKNRPILIYCYHGNASQEYAQMFSDFGFAEVYSLDGGYDAWINRPQEPEEDESAPLDLTLVEWLAAQRFPPGNINAAGANAATPLMTAAHAGNSDIVRLLIAAGAAVNARNADGNTALWLACVGQHLDIIDILLDAGIDIDSRNDSGATSLIYASSSGKADVVARLLARGADASLETTEGFSALDLASSIECLTLLRPTRQAKPIPEPS